MAKFIAIALTLLIGVAFCDEVLEQLLHRVPGIHEVAKPTLKFLEDNHMNDKAAEIQKELAQLDHLVKNGHHDQFGIRVQMLSAERRVIAFMKKAILTRSALLYPKADQAIHANAHMAAEIKKEKATLEQMSKQLESQINQYDNNIKLEKEIIAVQDRLEKAINSALGHH